MAKFLILVCLVNVFICSRTECSYQQHFEEYIEYIDRFGSLEAFQAPVHKPSEEAFIGAPRGGERDCESCPKGEKCVPPIQCPSHTRRKHGQKPRPCQLHNKKRGYCCQKEYNPTVNMPSKYRKDKSLRNFAILQDVLVEARKLAANMTKHSGHTLLKGSPDFLHQLTLQSPFSNPRADGRISQWALEQVLMGKLMSERIKVSPVEVFESVNMNDDSSVCLRIPKCRGNHLLYRTADGNCNNPLPERSLWGAAGQPMERLLTPAYEDSIWMPRMHSVDGSVLTSARKISRVVFPDFDRPHNVYNLLFMQFGQFISHDFTQSSSMKNDDGSPIQCCTEDGSSVLPPEELHFACMPIIVDSEDEFYSSFNQGCINFVRLSLAPYPNCRIGFGKQISKATHFLDASQVYGSSIEDQHLLRSFQGGQLRMFPGPNGDMLPVTTRSDSCEGTGAGKLCYLSGDARTNLIISLTLLHTTFAREHNRLAAILSHINPLHSEETLFQEARRILIGELQHIIYSEYLPLLIGSSAMHRFQLYPEKNGYSNDYDPDVNPASMNEVTGAAFRFGHSTVDGYYRIRSQDKEENIEIPDVMFDPGRLEEPGFFTVLMKTLLSENMQKVDHSITRGLSAFMFRGNKPFGIDLVATNIQRGRDHGIRSYNDYLELTGRNRVESFHEFGPIASRLSLVYNHPEDIDLWVGGLLESPYQDAVVGQLFAEIIAEQFSRFKRGDRYFYSHHPKINPGHFTPCQLRELRKASLARIICDNIPTISHVQRFAFINNDFPGNQPIRCENIPKIDLSCWQTEN